MQVKLVAVESGTAKSGRNWFRGSFKLTRETDSRSAIVTEWLSETAGKKALELTRGGAEPLVDLVINYDDSFHMAIIDMEVVLDFDVEA